MRKDTSLKAQMYLHIKKWQAGGLSQKAYCEEQAIKYHIFHYWYKLYRDEGLPLEPKPSFIPLQISAAAAPRMELFFAGGHRVVFHELISVDYLKALMS